MSECFSNTKREHTPPDKKLSVAMAPNGSKQKKDKGTIVHCIAGAMAGAVSRVVVSPLDVIKIRFQVQQEPIKAAAKSHYTGLFQAFKMVVREEGVKVGRMRRGA